MTNIVLKDKYQKSFQAVFALFIIFSLAGSLVLSGFIETPDSCIIIPVSPFDGNSFFEALSEICLYDLIMLWIIGIPLCRSLRVIVSSSVYFWRGIVMGCAFKVMTENSLSAVAIIIILSYMAVTMIALIYDAIINTTAERGFPFRLLSLLIVTGGCTLIRLLPMLLIK